jgi:hypothetical protein
MAVLVVGTYCFYYWYLFFKLFLNIVLIIVKCFDNWYLFWFLVPVVCITGTHFLKSFQMLFWLLVPVSTYKVTTLNNFAPELTFTSTVHDSDSECLTSPPPPLPSYPRQPLSRRLCGPKVGLDISEKGKIPCLYRYSNIGPWSLNLVTVPTEPLRNCVKRNDTSGEINNMCLTPWWCLTELYVPCTVHCDTIT